MATATLDQAPAAIHQMLDLALAYAKEIGRVFPLHSIRKGKCTCSLSDECKSPGKHPRTQNGVKDATRNESTIRQWWKRWPDANIGIATGEGLYVVDEDTHKGANHADLGEMTETLTVKTGGGGYQYYYSTDLDLGNTANKLGKSIDTRGEGGYVVAPGSVHLSGNMYQWVNDAPIAPLPVHLVEKLRAKPNIEPRGERSPIAASFGDSAYGAAALDDECGLVASTPEGGRNDQLNRSAFLMGNLIAGDALTESTAIRELTGAALRSGLSESEIEKTLQSGLAAGMSYPRKAPPREISIPPVQTVESDQAQPTTLEEALALVAELRAQNAALEKEKQLQADVIAGVRAHVFSKWELEATRIVGIAALLISYERTGKIKQHTSLYATFPMVAASGHNAKGERYTGLAEHLNIGREKVGEALAAFDATGQIRRWPRSDEKSHYDYCIDRSFISNEHPVSDKKPYPTRAPRVATKPPVEKPIDVAHTCLDCGSPNLDCTCRNCGVVIRLGELPEEQTPEEQSPVTLDQDQKEEVMSEIPTLLASHLGSVGNSDTAPAVPTFQLAPWIVDAPCERCGLPFQLKHSGPHSDALVCPRCPSTPPKGGYPLEWDMLYPRKKPRLSLATTLIAAVLP